jgi:hypothetical protein
MAYATIPGGPWWFGWLGPEPTSNTPATTNSLNQTTRQRHAWVFRAPKTGTIDRVIAGMATVTALVDVRVSLQDLASGNPDGTEDQFRDHVAGDFAVNTVFRSGLLTTTGLDGGARRTVTKGDMLAVVFRWTGSPGGTAQLQPTMRSSGGSPYPSTNLSYVATFNGTTWTKFADTPCFGLEYSDGSVASVGWYYPTGQTTTQNVSSITTPDEVGLRFVPAFTGRLTAAGFYVGAVTAGTAIRLYDDADTLLGTFTPTGTAENHDADSPTMSYWPDIVLTRGRVYRITLRPTTATNHEVPIINLDANAAKAYPGHPNDYWTERTDDGAWSNNTLKRPIVMLGYSAVDVAQVAP